MEGAQVFTCKSGGNLRSILSRNNDAAMFLKVENNKISGKGYICNTEGKNVGTVRRFGFFGTRKRLSPDRFS